MTDGVVPTISAAKAAISRCRASRSSSFDSVGMDGRDDDDDDDDDDDEDEEDDGIDGGGPITNAILPILALLLVIDGAEKLLSNNGTCGRRSLPF